MVTNVSMNTGYFTLVLLYECFLTSDVLFKNYNDMFDGLHYSTSAVFIALIGGFYHRALLREEYYHKARANDPSYRSNRPLKKDRTP